MATLSSKGIQRAAAFAKKNDPWEHLGIFYDSKSTNLGGGNSNMFYFHPDCWGNDPI